MVLSLSSRIMLSLVSVFVFFVCAGRLNGTEISGTISSTLTIMDDSELVGDVTCLVVDAPCIQLGVSGIRLRLDGFTITGRGNPPTDCTSTTVFAPEDGIQVAGQSGVAVLGPGLVQKFRRWGMSVLNSTKTKVRHVTFSDNCFSGLQLIGATDTEIEGNVSVRNAGGSNGFPCGGT
jgi:hypothetical protein